MVGVKIAGVQIMHAPQANPPARGERKLGLAMLRDLRVPNKLCKYRGDGGEHRRNRAAKW